ARLSAVGSRLRIDGKQSRIEIDAEPAPIEVTNSRGVVKIRKVRETVRVENSRGEVSIELVVAAPLFASTTRDRLEIVLPVKTGVTLDARAENGAVRGAPAEPARSSNSESPVQNVSIPIAGGGPTVTLRNTDGDIVITRKNDK
ncbi:MAG: hypothetical protein ACRD1T_10085, partial [Acidimicrobiia bacterium]